MGREVEAVLGAYINLKNTTITDYSKLDGPFKGKGFTVFFEGEECYFETFGEAYDFAVEKGLN